MEPRRENLKQSPNTSVDESDKKEEPVLIQSNNTSPSS